MMTFASFLLVFFAMFGVSHQDAQPYNCQGSHVIQPPTNLNDTYWYPNNFGNSPPVFASNQMCNFQVVVPPGMFATFTLAVHLPKDALCYSLDYNDVSESYIDSNKTLNFFIQPGATLHLIMKDNPGNFGFSINWNLLPQKFTPEIHQISNNVSQPTVISTVTSISPYLFTADTRVSILPILPFSSSIDNYDSVDIMKSVLVYDGPDWNSTCLGSLFNLYKLEKQWVSTGKQLTVYRLNVLYFPLIAFVVQDYSNTMNIDQYKTSNPYYSQYAISLSSTNGSAAIFTYSSGHLPDYIDSVVLDGNAKLDIYDGGVMADKSNLLVSYDKNNIKNSFPQEIIGQIRTYVISNGTGTFNLTSFSSMRNYGTAYDGRKGFMASRYYKANYIYSQDTRTTFTGKIKDAVKYFDFTYTIRDIDLSKNGNLTIYVSNDKTGNFTQFYNGTNSPALNQPINVTGYSMTVYLQESSQTAKNFFLEFGMTEVKSATKNLFNIFIILVFYIVFQL